ncbi:unnamed protein product [Lupinus luteus]|uniref:Uncharacterized protein n=1 Tax=Lupinus luteus TaxID=3873 RepID=A0AAV1YQJ2_LUPLU
MSNSGMSRGQGGAQRNQINNINMLGESSNVSFPNSGPGSSSQRVGVDSYTEGEFNFPSVGNGFSFVDPSPSSRFVQSNLMDPGSSTQGQGQEFSNRYGNQLLSDQQYSQQVEYQNFQHSQQSMQQYSAPPNNQQQQNFQSMRGGIGSIGPMKFESQVNNDQFGQHQQLPSLRNLAPPKLEPQQTDQPFFTHQQQEQLLHMSRQSPQAAAAVAAQMKFLNNQRLSQSQQHQPQQFVKTEPEQQSQHFQQQDMPIRSPANYEPGMCARRLTQYICQQQDRPEICSWEFCARRHEDLIPKRLLIPQISQLGTAAQKFQSCTQNATSSSSVPELQNNCDMFVASAQGLAKTLEVPLVNELGYTKRFVRCLQISEVVNSMKDLMDYCRDSGMGPMESLLNFTRRKKRKISSCGLHSDAQQSEDQIQKQSQAQPQQQQQHMVANTSNGDQKCSQNASSNGFTAVNNTLNSASASTTTSTIVGLLHQNSMNSRQQSSMNNVSSPYGGSSFQIPPPSSSNTALQPQPSASPFQSPAPSSSNNPPQSTANHTSRAKPPADISSQQQQPLLSGEADANELMSSQMNVAGGMTSSGSLGNDVSNANEIRPVRNAAVNGNSGVRLGNYGTMGTSPSGSADGNRPEIGSNSVMNRSIGMTSIARDQSINNHQQDLSSQLVRELGSVNDFDNLQFD